MKKKVVKKKQVVSNERLKTFYTSYSQSDGWYSWKIKAKDWAEAEFICLRIGHVLKGERVKV